MNHVKFKIDRNNNQIVFVIDNKIFDIKTVLGTAYTFIDKAYLFFDEAKNSRIKIFLKPKNQFNPKINPKKLLSFAGEFNNELLNQQLRRILTKENKKIREHIIIQALVSANPSQIYDEKEIDKMLEEIEGMDNAKDTENLIKPWDEQELNLKTAEKKKRKK